MTQHTNDAFGDETSRQDALPDTVSDVPSTEQERDEAAGTEAASARSDAAAAEAPTSRTSRRKSSRASQPADAEPHPAAAEATPAPPTLDPLRDLEAQGFSPAEARRLIYISDRIEQSAEARESEATLRRLRFTRWLVEHGMLDEWSA
jgi:hypothetical protein